MDSHKPLTAGEIEELKALEAKATPGPWAWEFTGDDNTCAVGTVMDENDNFVAGMIDGDADTVVVDSVCPEVSNQQDAAFIAAARNILPRLLSMLTPPPDAAVREAVEQVDGEIRVGEKVGLINDLSSIPVEIKTLRTLLRAVQAPRLTAEQRKVMRQMISMLEKPFHCRCGTIHGHFGASKFRAAFPQVFAGEVGE